MSQLMLGRWAAVPEGDIAVFLIGMRVNSPFRVDKWWPPVMAMSRMFSYLYEQPQTGFLGQRTWVGRTTLSLTYWRTADDIIAFAGDPDAPHVEPWRKFRRSVGDSGLVGVWHETYTVHAGDREAVYVNMPPFGLGEVIGTLPAEAGLTTAKQRLRQGRVAAAASDASAGPSRPVVEPRCPMG